MPNFIPKPYKKETVTIRISLEKLEKINQMAGQYDISRSAFINRCIDYALEGAVMPNEKTD